MVRCVYYETIQCMIAISKGLCAHGLPHNNNMACSYSYCNRDDYSSAVHDCACIEVEEDDREENTKVISLPKRI
jgi:hypothetical protein